MSQISIINGKIVTETKIEKNQILTLDDGKIASFEDDKSPDNTIELKETDLIMPGFIDLHVHGGGGSDVMEDSEQALKTIAAHLSQHGVTGWLATTYSAPIVDMADVGAAASWLLASKNYGAEVLGVHHEGPFLAKDQRGAHPEGPIKEPNLNDLEELIAPAAVSIVTLAPELPNALDIIDRLKERNIIAGIGHTDANFDQIKAAVEHGAKYVVHSFNTMAAFHHREPGGIGEVLIDDRLTCELIADLAHVHPAAIQLLIKAKGVDRVVLASDALAPTGLREGTYQFAGQNVQAKNGQVRLENGDLAGSIITLDQAVKNMVLKVGIDLVAVSKMVSQNPAKILSLDKTKGQLKVGYDADVTILDKDYTVLYTIVGGNTVFQKDLSKESKSETELKKEAAKEFEKFLEKGN